MVFIFDEHTKILLIILSLLIFNIICWACILSKLTMGTFCCCKKRVVVEHVIGHIKKNKILSTKYRNRRKRFGLRFNLICGIYNYENSGLI